MNKFIIIMVLAMVATINAAYLTYIAISFQPSFCDISSTLSCSESLTAPSTSVFGWPFPAVALLVYPIIFGLAAWGYVANRKKMFNILVFLAGGGILFNSYFIYQEYLLGAFCPLCLLCSVIIVTIFGISLKSFEK